MSQVRIMASGGLDEHAIAALLADGAPIDGFGVGTTVDVAADRPYLDAAYKLVAYDGRDCGKLSPGKVSLPGRKQVFRRYVDGVAAGDTIARHDEPLPGEALLNCVMQDGRRLPAGRVDTAGARAHAAAELARLPAALRTLEPAEPYPVTISPGLQAAQQALVAAHPKKGRPA